MADVPDWGALENRALAVKATLTSGVIDDPEDLLGWLGTDGLTILTDWLEQRAFKREKMEIGRRYVEALESIQARGLGTHYARYKAEDVIGGQ